MRKLPLGVVISTSVHAVVLAWVSARVLPRRAPPAPPPPALIEIVAVDRPATPAEAAPLEVALLDEPVPPAPTAAPPSATPRPAPAIAAPAPVATPPHAPAIVATTNPPREAAIVASTAAATAPAGSGDASADRLRLPPASSLLAMRHGEVPRAALTAGRWDALDHVPLGTTPEASAATGALHESGSGTFRSDQQVFAAKVAADGSIKLTDKPNLTVGIALPSIKQIGNGLSAWYNSDKSTGGPAALSDHVQASAGASTSLSDRTQPNATDRTPTVIVPVIGGHFDVTDWMMRRHGADPYAARKLAFLDATRDERVQIGNRHRADQLAHSTQLMQHNLEALWAAPGDLAARKRALFELWDECAETGEPAVVAGGQAARTLVIGFIRGHLPAGSPDAFTADELAALARGRQSTAAFQPYAP